jgi:hypothetical protein
MLGFLQKDEICETSKISFMDASINKNSSATWGGNPESKEKNHIF